MRRDQQARALVLASISGRLDRATGLVESDPSLVSHNIWTAAVVGRTYAPVMTV